MGLQIGAEPGSLTFPGLRVPVTALTGSVQLVNPSVPIHHLQLMPRPGTLTVSAGLLAFGAFLRRPFLVLLLLHRLQQASLLAPALSQVGIRGRRSRAPQGLVVAGRWSVAEMHPASAVDPLEDFCQRGHARECENQHREPAE